MNAAVLIASRELRDRGRLFFIAVCMAVVPFLAAFAVKENRQLAIATVTAFVAAAYTSALALAMGVSMIGRDLTEKRLSFLFSKPVSAASIWLGKVTAGIATWLGAFAIVVLPTFLFANEGWKDMWSGGGALVLVYALISSTAIFFGSHAASTMLRSRSAVVALDFTLLVVMVIALFGMMRPILLGGGLDVVIPLIVSVCVALLIIMAIAPIWQISRGRIDPRRNHAAFSAAFWSGAAIVMIAAFAYAMWVISPPLASITDYFAINQSPTGRWIYLSGQTNNRGSYLASFVIDRTTGERERIAVSPWGTVHHTADGKSMVWLQYDDLLPGRGVFRFYTRRIENGAKQVATPLTMPMPRSAQLSHDGSRVAVTRSKQLEVYELATGRQLGVAPGIEDGDVLAMYFAGADAVRVAELSRGPQPKLIIRTFDLRGRKLTSTPPLPAKNLRLVQFNRDGSRLFVRGEGMVLDAQTGAVLARQLVTPVSRVYGAMLRDGSTVVSRNGKLFHYDVNGTPAADIAIPVQHASVMAQLGESKIVLSSGGKDPAAWRTFVVDLAARKVESVTPGIRTAYSWWNEPLLPQFTEDATLVAMETGRKLVLWNPRTGEKQPFPM
jgi:hypothetical protein